MGIVDAADLLDGLPNPCIYLTRDKSIVYANVAARDLVSHRTTPSTQLTGCRLDDTNFAEEQVGSTEELKHAFHQFIGSDRVDSGHEQDAEAGIDKHMGTMVADGGQHAASSSIKLHPSRKRTSDGRFKTSTTWTITRTTIRERTYFCLLGQPSVDNDIASEERKWDMLQSIARPAMENVDYSARICSHDLSRHAVNDIARAQYATLAKAYEDRDTSASGWMVWKEDFIQPVTFLQGLTAEALDRKSSLLSNVRGIEDPVTGTRTIIDAAVTLLNDPNNNDLLGCLIQARPGQEWSQFLLHYHMAMQAQSGGTQQCPLVRTMLLDGNLDYFSPSWVDLTGHSSIELCSGTWQDYVHPKDLPRLQQRIKFALESGTRQECEVRYRAADAKSYHFFADTIAPYKDATTGLTTRWYCTSFDIHELASQRRAANLASQRLFSILDDIGLAVVEISSDYILSSVEGSVTLESTDGTQQSANAWTGLSLEDGTKVINDRDRPGYIESMKNVMDGKSPKEIVDYQAGGKHWRSIFAPIKDDVIATTTGEAKIRGVLNLAMDWSARHSNEQAALKIQAMQHSSRLKDEFVANISHELRTPIAGILGLLDLITDTKLNSSQLELVQNLQTSAATLLRIVSDLLDLSKVEADAMPFEKAPFNLADILSDANTSFNALAVNKGLILKIVATEECPMLLGDSMRVRQVVHNLLSNAIKFTDTGSIDLTVSHEVEEADVVVTMVVQDTGIGISEEILARLFEPFMQADQSTTRIYGGTGLGLSIARKLAQAMGGDVVLTSKQGEGTRSEFTLKLELCPETASPAEELSASLTADPSSVKLAILDDKASAWHDINVLVVEDNKINQKVITGHLKKLGLTHIACAAHGGEAIAHVTAACKDNRPDLIFMDCQMPVLDGFAATRQLRSDLSYDGPIIALTASAIQGYREECLKAGMNDYLTKPFTKEELANALESWLPKALEANAVK